MAEKGKKRVPKRVRSSGEGIILVDSDSSVDDASELSLIEGSPTATDHVDLERASLPQEFIARSRSEGAVLPSGEAQLREELEVSYAEVARLQSLLQGGGIRSSVVANYLQSHAYRHQVEFERAHHSQGEYVKALSDPLVAISDAQEVIFHFSPLIELAGGFSHIVTLGVSQRGRPFGGDRAQGIHAAVLKEMRCQRY
ncbi:hypothetical protein ACLOJK_037911 [Asimina triloba]